MEWVHSCPGLHRAKDKVKIRQESGHYNTDMLCSFVMREGGLGKYVSLYFICADKWQFTGWVWRYSDLESVKQHSAIFCETSIRPSPITLLQVSAALSSLCLQSGRHPADTILALFTRVCSPQPAFVVCILNAQQRGIPFGSVVSWNKSSASALLPALAWGEKDWPR